MKRAVFSLLLLCLTVPASATTYYVSTSGSDSNPCTQTAKCQSFNRAYQVARAGDTVLVAAGTYGGQSFSKNANISGAYSVTPHATDVVFRPEGGAVTVGALQFGTNGTTPEHITIEDMWNSADTNLPRAACVHFVKTTHRSRSIYLGPGTSYVSFQKIDAGAHNDADGIDVYGAHHVLLEDSVIHDVNTVTDGAHPDGFATCGASCGVAPVHDITLRRNKFYRNACINYRGDGDDGAGIVIENNFFGNSVDFLGGNCGQSVQIHGNGVVVRYNTINGNIQHLGSGEGNNQYWTGNIVTGVIGSYEGCPGTSGTVAEYNVWNSSNSTTCGAGATNLRVSSFTGWFVNASSGDLHLTSSASTAVGAGNSRTYPSTDIDGYARPFGGSVDAGASEYGSTTSASTPPSAPTNLTVIVR
jgi:hypothetical protein